MDEQRRAAAAGDHGQAREHAERVHVGAPHEHEQHLPPRQRAVLILREVLCWQASEVAELLDTTVASVNSALQRARATMSELDADRTLTTAELGDAERALLARYVAAFEAYDVEALVQLLHEDAAMSMPPLALWLRGVEDMRGWYLGHGIGCKDSKLVPLVANGLPAFAHYKPRADGPGFEPRSIQVLEITDGRVSHIHHFLDTPVFSEVTPLFERFGLPRSLD